MSLCIKNVKVDRQKLIFYLLVVISTIVWTSDDSGPLFSIGSDEIYLRVVEDLVVLVRGELVHVELHHLVGGGHHRLGLQQGRGRACNRANVRNSILVDTQIIEKVTRQFF